MQCVWPSVGWYCPGEQRGHDGDPSEETDEPAGQGVHTSSPDADPTDVVPAGQGLQPYRLNLSDMHSTFSNSAKPALQPTVPMAWRVVEEGYCTSKLAGGDDVSMLLYVHPLRHAGVTAAGETAGDTSSSGSAARSDVDDDGDAAGRSDAAGEVEWLLDSAADTDGALEGAGGGDDDDEADGEAEMEGASTTLEGDGSGEATGAASSLDGWPLHSSYERIIVVSKKSLARQLRSDCAMASNWDGIGVGTC